MKRLLLLLTMCFPVLLYSQQAVLGTGGEGTGSGGTSSFSVGQVAYTYKGTGPSVDEGVQQAFEVTNLPIELLYFEAEVYKEDKVKLSWETATELNNDYFTLERSASGRDWEYVGKVSGSGTTTEPQSYSYVDVSPYMGFSYYRLKQTDFDGSFSYSEIRSVHISPRLISLYPNPFRDYVSIETGDFPLEYNLSDLSGKLLKFGVIADSQTQLDLSDVPVGVYTFRLKSKGQQIFIDKLIKLK